MENLIARRSRLVGRRRYQAQDADGWVGESVQHGGELRLRQLGIPGQVGDGMGDLGARRRDQIVEDARRGLLFTQRQQAHHLVQVRPHDALGSTQAAQRLQPQGV